MIKFANELVRARYLETRGFARKIGLIDQLEKRIAYLSTYGSGDEMKTECTLYPDSSPHCFGLRMRVAESATPNKTASWRELWCGLLAFHGPVDGFGSGAAPTLAVCVEPTHGWSVHT